MLKKCFSSHQKLINKNQNQKTEESIAERTKFRKERIAGIKKEEKNKYNELFKKYFTDYKSLGFMYKKLLETEGERKEDQVYAIKKVFNKMKKKIERVPENKKLRLKKTKK